MTEEELALVRRQQILNAATTIFAENGYERTRMDDIAAAAEVSKGTLYLYFDSKEAIFLALLNAVLEGQFAALEKLLEGGGSASALLALLSDQMSMAFEQYQPLQPLMYEFFSLVGRDHAVRDIMRGMYRRGLDLLEGLLHQGVAAGEFRADLNVSQQALRLLVLNEGFEVVWMLSPSFDLMAEKRAALADLVNGWHAHGDER